MCDKIRLLQTTSNSPGDRRDLGRGRARLRVAARRAAGHLDEVGAAGRERRAEHGHARGRREEEGRRRRHHVQVARERVDVRVRPRRRPPACTTLTGLIASMACDTVVCLSWSLSHQAPHRWRAASMASSGARLKHRLRGLGTATEGRRHKNQQDAGNTRRRRAVGEVRDVRDGRVVGAGQVRAARGRDDDDARRLVRAALQVGPEAGPVRGELDGLALPFQGQAPGGALACVQLGSRRREKLDAETRRRRGRRSPRA